MFLLFFVQILWPKDLTRPFLNVDVNNFGLRNRQQLSEELKSVFKDPEIKISFNDKEQLFKISDLGGSVNIDSLERYAYKYSLLERLIPFSVFKNYTIERYRVDYDRDKLNKFISKYSEDHKVYPRDADIEILDNGEVKIKDSTSGAVVDKGKMIKSLINFEYSTNNKNLFKAPINKIKPEKLNKYFEQAIIQIKKLLSKDIYFTYRYKDITKTYVVKRPEIIRWILVKDDKGLAKVTVNGEEYKKFIHKINLEQEIAAGTTIVEIVDGVETNRQLGINGVKVSFEKNFEIIDKYFSGENEKIKYDLIIDEFKPKEKRNYSYSFSQPGLQAKINHIGLKYNVRISLRQLNGYSWSAGYRANEVTPSASTYKLFVALRLFKEMNEGGTNWNDTIQGTPIRNCFHQMIIVSSNACAEAWLSKYGRQGMNEFVYSIGVSRATSFTNRSATTTSANDIQNTIAGIYNGQLVTGENRKIMLDHLARQQWRSGIPSGSNGVVFDKVGFLWNYIHDVAVVEHPKGTYAVAIMTSNASYKIIAEITRELEAFMYP